MADGLMAFSTTQSRFVPSGYIRAAAGYRNELLKTSKSPFAYRCTRPLPLAEGRKLFMHVFVRN